MQHSDSTKKYLRKMEIREKRINKLIRILEYVLPIIVSIVVSFIMFYLLNK